MSAAARRADKELARRGHYAAAERLLFVVRAPDRFEASARAEAEELLLGWFGWPLWCELGTMTSWRLVPDLHQDALVLLLERLRDGAEDLWRLKRRGIREVAFDAAWWRRAAAALDGAP